MSKGLNLSSAATVIKFNSLQVFIKIIKLRSTNHHHLFLIAK